MTLELLALKAGDTVRTLDGNLAVVVQPSEDGEWVLVKYVDCPATPSLVGTEDLCSEDELENVA